VVLAGCGSVFEGEPDDGDGGTGGAGAGPFEHPTGAQDVLVSVDIAGGYTALQYELRNTPDFLLLGDGTVMTPSVTTAIFPGPAIRTLQSTTVDEEQIQELLAAADDAGLLGEEIDYGEPGVTDMDTTTVIVNVDGTTHTQSAYALGPDDANSPDLDEAARSAREALQEFIETAQTLVGADSQAYVPSEVLAFRLSTEMVAPVEEPDLVQPPMPWPVATVPPPVTGSEPSSCAEISGQEAADLLAALASANELTPWVIGDEPAVGMAFRPKLPGDAGCK